MILSKHFINTNFWLNNFAIISIKDKSFSFRVNFYKLDSMYILYNENHSHLVKSNLCHKSNNITGIVLENILRLKHD
jgi:hypothetical protein